MLEFEYNVFLKRGNKMKKLVIILSSLLVVLTFAVSGFSKAPQSRKLAQAAATETEIGSVKAFERTYELSFDACQKNTKFNEPKKKGHDASFECDIDIFPDTGEELYLSNSLGTEDKSIIIKQDKQGQDIIVRLRIYFGFRINVYWHPELTTVSKEEFLAAAKQLINKHPRVTEKLIKVVH